MTIGRLRGKSPFQINGTNRSTSWHRHGLFAVAHISMALPVTAPALKGRHQTRATISRATLLAGLETSISLTATLVVPSHSAE
jgi:hypothetical protein